MINTITQQHQYYTIGIAEQSKYCHRCRRDAFGYVNTFTIRLVDFVDGASISKKEVTITAIIISNDAVLKP
jgi:hypothetical protein